MLIPDYSSQVIVNKDKGFTLVELMITIVLTSVIIAAVYSAYRVQQQQYTNQTQVVEMQQNIRAAISLMMDEIRMAGYDPSDSANSSIEDADINSVHFTKDITNTAGTADDGDGRLDGPSENIKFGFSPTDDHNSDGIANNGAASLMLSLDNGVSYIPIADDIHAIEFSYTLADGTTSTSTTSLNNIRTITISILARAKYPDLDFTNSMTYTTGAGNSWGPYNDNYRRRLLISNVNCRNMGY